VKDTNAGYIVYSGEVSTDELLKSC